MNDWWIAAAVAGVLVLVVAGIILHRRQHRYPDLNDMEGHAFEHYCADLLEERGFQEVQVTPGSKEYGVDILAWKDGVSYAIQCKRYSVPVGVKAIQEAYAGRDYYDCMVGAVLTNQFFTKPAVEAAKKLKILMWDGGYLEQMIEESEERDRR